MLVSLLIDPDDDKYRLSCTGLSKDVDDEALGRPFQNCSSFLKASVQLDENGKNSGCGFVYFKYKENVTNAMKELCKMGINSKWLPNKNPYQYNAVLSEDLLFLTDGSRLRCIDLESTFKLALSNWNAWEAVSIGLENLLFFDKTILQLNSNKYYEFLEKQEMIDPNNMSEIHNFFNVRNVKNVDAGEDQGSKCDRTSRIKRKYSMFLKKNE